MYISYSYQPITFKIFSVLTIESVNNLRDERFLRKSHMYCSTAPYVNIYFQHVFFTNGQSECLYYDGSSRLDGETFALFGLIKTKL